MPTLVRNLQDWLLELRQLKDKAQCRHDEVQAEELQAEIEELTAYLHEVRASLAGQPSSSRSVDAAVYVVL